MITSLDLLNRLKVEKQLVSNRHVARFLEISHSTVNRIDNGAVWSDDFACEIADMLGLDVDLILLSVLAERSKNERAVEALERFTDSKKSA
ncbi:hypothetical protein G3U99_12705 [Vibrio coralliilyticus OCN008]|uniref:hypothetical protein n=1 Tax=Vibrio coralliilyticus TaxID=190893 RepID=UPI0004CFE1E9|nr:hypothetical protein [Vibrio coralliilyticus]QIJ85064.1 hypothetical protein G3U99_12705 [Vibrio coralliilyticus OCN008]